MLDTFFPSLAKRKRIFVPASAVAAGAADWALTGAVVEWLNAARDRGCYDATEIAEAAPQAYNADYYYAQVCNGGHKQFRHNSRMDRTTLIHAQAGLKAAGLTELHACLAELSERPDMDDDGLKALDDRFFAAYKDYHGRMNAWLRPVVEIVPDEAHAARMAAFLKRDRRREQRFRDREVLRLQAMSENEQRAGYGGLAFEMGVTFLRINAGSFETIAGERTIAWGITVRTEAGPRTYRGMTVAGRFLLVPELPKGRIETEEALIALFRSGRHRKTEDVAALCGRAKEVRAGAIVALLMQKAKGIDTGDVTAINLERLIGDGEEADIALIQRGGAGPDLTAGIGTARAVLTDTSTKRHLARMDRAEVDAALRAHEGRLRVH
jgi:hypothetical protein